MPGENVRNTCWRERYIRDDIKRNDNVWGECEKHMLEGEVYLG